MLGLITLLIVLVTTITFSIFLVLKNRTVVGFHVQKSIFIGKFHKFALTKCFILMFILIAIFSLLLYIFMSSTQFANADCSKSSCSMNNIKVDISNSGIDKVDSAVLSNNSDHSIVLNAISLCLIEKSASDSI